MYFPLRMSAFRSLAGALALLSVPVLATCYRGVTNYIDVPGPRYAGPVEPLPPPAGDSALRVVTWNVQWGRRPEAAAELIASHGRLRSADILLLQEMNEQAVAIIAERIGMGYVYYPATLHPRVKHHVGNAILSRWPITDDRKLLLPRLGFFGGTGRAAVVATVSVGEHRLRVYSLHLATAFEIGHGGIEDQLRTIIRDAADSPDPVVIGGDFNSTRVGGLLVEAGYDWVTQRIGRTAWILPIDHLFVRGMEVRATAGTVFEENLPSDHRPVWAEMHP